MKYIDMHCDTIREVWKSRLRGDKDSLRENNHMIDLLRMKDGDCLCQNLGIFINLHEPLHYSGRDDTEEGRRQNRRVEIVFIRNDVVESRHPSEAKGFPINKFPIIPTPEIVK